MSTTTATATMRSRRTHPRQTPLAANEMGHIRGVIQFILDRHKPYAASILDRYSNCLMGNGASDQMIGALVDPSLVSEHANLLRMDFRADRLELRMFSTIMTLGTPNDVTLQELRIEIFFPADEVSREGMEKHCRRLSE